MLYVVNREDGQVFKPAKDIDMKYAELLKEAKDSGVEILVYKTSITETEIKISHKVDMKI